MGLNCREVSRRIASDEWETLHWHNRLLVGLHLFLCNKCRRYKSHLKTMRVAAKDLWTPQEDSQTLDRLKAEILKKSDP